MHKHTDCVSDRPALQKRCGHWRKTMLARLLRQRKHLPGRTRVESTLTPRSSAKQQVDMGKQGFDDDHKRENVRRLQATSVCLCANSTFRKPTIYTQTSHMRLRLRLYLLLARNVACYDARLCKRVGHLPPGLGYMLGRHAVSTAVATFSAAVSKTRRSQAENPRAASSTTLPPLSRPICKLQDAAAEPQSRTPRRGMTAKKRAAERVAQRRVVRDAQRRTQSWEGVSAGPAPDTPQGEGGFLLMRSSERRPEGREAPDHCRIRGVRIWSPLWGTR